MPPIPNSNGAGPLPSRNQGGGAKLAANLKDLERVPSMIRQMLLPGKLDSDPKNLVKIAAKETAVRLTCDLLSAACICDTLRSHDREAKDSPMRVYLKRQSWSKLPGNVLLTLMQDGKPILNSAVFGRRASDIHVGADTNAPAVPLAPRRVMIGEEVKKK